MSRLASKARFVSAISDRLTAGIVNRRNFSARSSAVVASAVREGSRPMIQRVEEKVKDLVGEKSPWMPDPATGNFVPEDQFGQVDVAQLRLILLNQSSRSARS